MPDIQEGVLTNVSNKKTISNVAFSIAYQLLLLILPLITTPYISRVFNKELIGEINFYSAIYSYFLLVTALGIQNYGSRYIAKNKDDSNFLRKAFSELQTLHFLSSFIVLALYAVYAFLISRNFIAQLYMIPIIFAALDIGWLFYGIEELRPVVIRNVLIRLASIALIFILVKKTEDIYLYILISCAASALSNVLLWPFVLRHKIYFKPAPLKDIKKHIKPMLILFLPTVGISLYKYMDKIMLGFFSMGETGLYGNAEAFISVPVCFVIALGSVMLPRLSNAVQKEEPTIAINKYLKPSMLFAVWLSCGLAAGIIGIASEFTYFYYGSGYEGCRDIIIILMFSSIFLAIANVVRTQVLMPLCKDKEYVISIFCGAGVNIIFNLVFIPLYGAIGAAIATVLAEATVCVIQIMQVRKICDILKTLLRLLPIPFIAAIVAIVMLLIPGEISIKTFAIKGAIGAGLFLTLSFFFGLFNRKWIFQKQK